MTPVLRRSCLALLLAGLWVTGLRAQAPLEPDDDALRFEHLTTYDGLSSNLITAVFQDRQGYIWIGTDGGGLLRYDGYDVTAYRFREGDTTSLGSDYVSAIHESSNGVLWIGTGKGLSRFDRARERFHTYRHRDGDPTSLSYDDVRVVCPSPDGHLWIGTKGGGLNRFDPATETFTAYRYRPDDPASLSSDRISTLLEAADGTLWIGTEDAGLDHLDVATESFRHYSYDTADPVSLSSNRVSALHQSADGTLRVGTDTGLNRYDPRMDSFHRYRHRPGDPASLSSDRVSVLHQSADGTLWIGTERGLNRYDPRTDSFHRYRHRAGDSTSLSSDAVSTITTSTDGTLWVGTYGIGLNRKDPASGTFRTYRLPASYRPDSGREPVTIPYESLNERLWVGTSDGTLFRLDPATGTIQPYSWQGDGRRPRNDIAIRALHEASDGILWIGTKDSGLIRLDPTARTLRRYRHEDDRPSSLSSDHVQAIRGADDGTIWIGTDRGLNRFDPATETFTAYHHRTDDPTSLSSDFILSVHASGNGVLWIGTDRGLNRFDPATETFTAYRHRAGDSTSLSSDWISALHESEAGTLWIGNDGGLDRLNGRATSGPGTLSFTRLSAAGDLGQSAVLSILEDDEGQLWLTQIDGLLVRFDPRTGRSRAFAKRHGIPAGAFGMLAGRNPSGRLFWVHTSGLVTVRPQDLLPSAGPPRLHLSDLWIFNERITPGPGSPLQGLLSETEAVTLTHRQNDLTFGFVGLHYAQPSGIRYTYRLRPYDHDWRPETSQRRATYTNLPPGDYTFEVRAANADGVRTEENAAVRIVISPPWWRTRWAYLLYGILAVAGLVGAGRLQRRRLVRRERELTTARELEHARQIETMNVRLRAQEQQLRDQNRKLLELDQLKSRFFANISHEFRTPLTLILGPLQDALDGAFGDLDGRLRRQLRVTQRNGRRLLRLINQLLDLSRLEAGKLTLRARRGDLVPLVKATTQAFASLARRKDLALTLDVPTHAVVLYFEPDKLEKILYNLLSNALKFTPAQGTVRVELEATPDEDAGYVTLTVADTGCGIPEKALPVIFDRFRQVDGSSTRAQEGSGIGLALVKELVELHGGTLHVESTVGSGTTFRVRLPRGKGHLAEAELVDEAAPAGDGASLEHEEALDAYLAMSPEEPEANGDVSSPEVPGEDAPVVLIVEDHADVRAYVRNHLAANYLIEEAVDGQAGLERVRSVVPDLVIADVMMPGMDGYALCRAVKTDPHLNHIPVILLTAKASDESKLEGLELGADAYLFKPFNMEELLARVENLIEVRRLLRARFSEEVLIRPSEVVVPSADAAFLEQVRAVAEAHLDDPAFDANRLAREVAVSRRHLQRKLKALTRLSVGGYLRTMRLERAAQLLEQRSGTVAEVAYRVGFKNADHFSRVFRQVFGVPPSQYPTA